MAKKLFPKLGPCIQCVGRGNYSDIPSQKIVPNDANKILNTLTETWDLVRAKDRLQNPHACHQQLSTASFLQRLEVSGPFSIISSLPKAEGNGPPEPS